MKTVILNIIGGDGKGSNDQAHLSAPGGRVERNKKEQ
jgi:hypothetical protein